MPADPSFTMDRVRAGAVAGFAGGLVFGLFLQLRGMMTDVIAPLAGSESALVGWLIHLAASVLFGIAFAVVMDEQSIWYGLRAGIAYGMILWIITGTLVLRLSLGMPFRVDAALGNLLVGHVLYGLIMGPVYAWRWRTAARQRAPVAARAVT